jgi:hypothetical protein
MGRHPQSAKRTGCFGRKKLSQRLIQLYKRRRGYSIDVVLLHEAENGHVIRFIQLAKKKLKKH